MDKIVWRKARKKPIIVEFREVIPTENDAFGLPIESVLTREGLLIGYPKQDYIIKGIEGECYPIKKDIFKKTYEVFNE